MNVSRSASRPHPCAPWFDERDGDVAGLFPGGRGAAPETLERRCRLLETWEAPDGFGDLVARVRREQGDAAAAALERVGAGEPVVFTGQQPSFAGGPMFVWLKAWTAVAQAERASRSLGRPVRALFWIAGDDSDLREVRALEDPLLRRVFDSHGGSVPDARLPVGALPMPAARRDELAREIGATWPDSALPEIVRGAPDLSTLMRDCLRHWFGDRLLLVDAAWPETRLLARDTYRRFARAPGAVHEALSEGIARATAAGLPVSIRTWPDRLRLFRVGAQGRTRLVADGAGGWTDGSARWTDSDLDAALAGGDASFSHDVVSRPFAAESAFPVLAHVLGPGECSYFACLGALSESMGRLAPVLPRASATLLPTGPWPQAMEAGWDPLHAPAPAYRRLADALLAARSPELDARSGAWAHAREAYLAALGEGARDVGALAGLDKRLESFEERFRRSLVRASESEHRADLESLKRLVRIAGEGGLQERAWSPWALEHHLGASLEGLAAVLDPMDPSHAVLEVS